MINPTAPAGESTPALSIVAPVFDEEQCIEPFVEELWVALASCGQTFEVICVDDGSTDATAGRLRHLCTRFATLRTIRLDGHHGQSAALAEEIKASRGQLMVLMDADLQQDPWDVGRLLGRLAEPDRPDAVVGVRRQRRDRWLRRVSSRLANWCSGLITGDPVADAGCGMKAFRAEPLRAVPFFGGAHRFLATLIRADGGTVVELPVNHRPRPFGRSKYGSGLSRTFVALRDAFGVRWWRDRRIRVRIVDPRSAP